MAFTVKHHGHSVAGRDLTVWVLEGAGERAEVCPELGFNCFRWAAGGRERLYRDPAFFTDGRPTRSGVPVLFPFPNRIRDGRFAWDGRDYQLPCNDSAGKNAIHGFACRAAWRVIDSGADGTSAWLTGEFHCAQDAPQSLPLWPADHRIRLTVRLSAGRLRLDAEVDNPDRVPLPFGLGYHPYFLLAGEPPDGVTQAPAASYWPLRDSLPAGTPVAVDAARDLRSPRPVRELTLDDVLTGLPADPAADGLCPRGGVDDLLISASPAFRELVAFTPPHRRALCLEPYTCTTDAIHLQARGLDAGLIVLPPGGRWSGAVELVLS